MDYVIYIYIILLLLYNLARGITSKTHLAGTQGEKDLAENIASKFRSYGLDDVKILPYKVRMGVYGLLSK